MALTNQEKNYSAFLKEVKSLIRQGHQKAAFAVNAALLNLYWNLGQSIAQQQSLFEGRNNYVEQLAKDLNEKVRGWVSYFGKYAGSSMHNIYAHINRRLVKWCMWKYRKFKRQAITWMYRKWAEKPMLFVHWQQTRWFCYYNRNRIGK